MYVCVCRERVGDPSSGWHHSPRSHQTVSAGSRQRMGRTTREENEYILTHRADRPHAYCFLCLCQGEFKVTERNMVMKDLLGALDAGRVLEVFGAGTACVVCPVGSLLYKGKVGLSKHTDNKLFCVSACGCNISVGLFPPLRSTRSRRCRMVLTWQRGSTKSLLIFR